MALAKARIDKCTNFGIIRLLNVGNNGIWVVAQFVEWLLGHQRSNSVSRKFYLPSTVIEKTKKNLRMAQIF